jgi:hypothetical protein
MAENNPRQKAILRRKAAASIQQFDQLIAGLWDGDETSIRCARSVLIMMVETAGAKELAMFLTVPKLMAEKVAE